MKKLVFTSIFLNIAIIAILVIQSTNGNNSKSAFFLSAKVYNEFDLKEELEADLSKVEYKMRSGLDSMESDLTATLQYLKSTNPTDAELLEYEKKKYFYLEFKSREEANYNEKFQEYYNVIWSRINDYVKEFGKENGYTYIYGANGDGSIMYADESNDITEEIIVYLNSQYAGE